MKVTYIDKESIIKITNKVCVWGTGIDSEELVSYLQLDKVNSFIDSNRSGFLFQGKKIISFEEYMQEKNYDPIIVASYRFAKEIIEIIEKSPLENTKIYIWDNQHIFCKDNNIDEFIRFNRKIWKKECESEKKGIVVIPFDNRHAVRPIVHAAYCANYFADKYGAEIWGYFRFGGKTKNISNTVLDVYKSINMKGVISEELSEKQNKEVDQLTEIIWSGIHSWADWNEIVIRNIKIGTTIIRHILRHYIPTFEPKTQKMKRLLKECVQTFVFWHDYIYTNDVKAVLMADGVCWDGYIRDIAISKGIETYIIDERFKKLSLNYYGNEHLPYIKKFWNELSNEEKAYGIEWAKNELQARITGKTKYVQTTKDTNVFANERNNGDVLKKSGKEKVLICPHIFEEDSYQCGEQIFDNNYIEWLDEIGRKSKNLNYDFYIKEHPAASKRDHMILEAFKEKYPNIELLDKNCNPKWLKEEGISWALTVCGTIAQEYPLLGIQVINAGHNPGESFDFAWNPKTKEDYYYLLDNIRNLKPKDNIEDIYSFYAIYYLYYDRKDLYESCVFFESECLEWSRRKLKAHGLDYGTWQYKAYMDEWDKVRHNKVKEKIPDIFDNLRQWDPSIFYRKKL